MTKTVEGGKCWIFLLLGPIVPLLRKDWKWFFISLPAILFTLGLSNILFVFKYNEWYVNDLIWEGFEEVTDQSFNLGDRQLPDERMKVPLRNNRGDRSSKDKRSYKRKKINSYEGMWDSNLPTEEERLARRGRICYETNKQMLSDKEISNRKRFEEYSQKVISPPTHTAKSISRPEQVKLPEVGKLRLKGTSSSKEESEVSVERLKSSTFQLSKTKSPVATRDGGVVKYKSKEHYVKVNSAHYAQLSKVVKVVNLKKVDYPRKIVKKYPFDSKQRYDNINNRDSVLHGYIVKNRSELKRTISNVFYNTGLKKVLHNEYRSLSESPSLRSYEDVESQMLRDLFEATEIDTDFTLSIIFSYTSPKGWNHYETEEEFTAYELVREIENMIDIKDERSEFEIFRDAERAKVTPGVRYDIMKRDNFMCQICGATADHGVTLHIDHIVPIAKWGKSEESNLQTLCKDCNLGKGTKDF